MTTAFWATSLAVHNSEVSETIPQSLQPLNALKSSKDQTEIPVSAILHPPLPPTNLYFLSISRIHQVKQGPFFEHSSQLYSIATGVQYWSKVNSGLFKMYEVCGSHDAISPYPNLSDVQAEVLGKRVVVQHIPLGGLLQWDPKTPQKSRLDPSVAPTSSLPAATTAAPWSRSSTSQPAYSQARSGLTHTAALTESGAPLRSSDWCPSSQPPRLHSAAQRTHASPLVAAQLPLGPLANPSLRPTKSAPDSRSTTLGPTATNTPPSSADDRT